MSISERLISSLHVGTVMVNTFTIPLPFMPFGGMKESGLGMENGEEAMLEYSQVKSVYYQLSEPTQSCLEKSSDSKSSK